MSSPRATRWFSSVVCDKPSRHWLKRGSTCDGQASHADDVQVQPAQVLAEASAAEVKHWQDVRSTYRNHLSNLSLILHPWYLLDSTRQTSNEVERRLQDEIEALESLIERHGLPAKKNTLAKVRKQLAGLSALVDFWWQTVGRDLEHMALPLGVETMVDELLLPLMYWQEQLSRTRGPGQKGQDRPGAQGRSRRFREASLYTTAGTRGAGRLARVGGRACQGLPAGFLSG